MPDTGLAPGALVLDRYRLEAPLASRLGGEAWLAEDPEGGARVEVHLLAATPEREQAFAPVRQAIDGLARAPSAAIARPLRLEWGEDGRLVLVLEYHDGRALSTLLAARPARPDEAREVLRGLLHALAHATRAGVAHGRLTPARVLLGAENQVALLDLGIAPLLDPAADEAPWRAPGEARGARADAFAVAVVALELLAARRPERGQPLPPVAPEMAAAVGAGFLDAVERLARADGSAQVFDPGALLGLLPPRRTRARRSRFGLSEVWDGDIGSGTARLLKLALSPEYQGRMPEEIRGQAQDQDDGEGPDELEFLTSLPGVFAIPPRPTAAAPPPPPALEATLPPSKPETPAAPDASVSGSPTLVKTVVLPRPSGPPAPAVDLAKTVDEPPPFQIKVTPAPPRPRSAGPLLLRTGPDQAAFLIAGAGRVAIGRERGNDLVLRAFKGTEVDGIDSNRISRRHLTLAAAAGGLQLTDEKSAYGTSLDGARLPPGEARALPPAAFALHLAGAAVALEGRAFAGSGALRLLRDDRTGHQYLLLLGPRGTALRVGSAPEEDALLVKGTQRGHALLRLDPEGVLQVAPGEGPVSVAGQPLARGAWADLHPGPVELGPVRLDARPLNAPYDFFSVASALSV